MSTERDAKLPPEPSEDDGGKPPKRRAAEKARATSDPSRNPPNADPYRESRTSIEPAPRSSALPTAPPPPSKLWDDAVAMVEHFGIIGRMTWHTFLAIFRRPLEIGS